MHLGIGHEAYIWRRGNVFFRRIHCFLHDRLCGNYMRKYQLDHGILHCNRSEDHFPSRLVNHVPLVIKSIIHYLATTVLHDRIFRIPDRLV